MVVWAVHVPNQPLHLGVYPAEAETFARPFHGLLRYTSSSRRIRAWRAEAID